MLLCRLPTGEPEIFATVQGEGPTCGVPSVFVRLADCNLACSWCDTAHSWNWAAHDRAAETIDLPVEEVEAAVKTLAGTALRNLVVTGGEPLLQQAALAELVGSLRASGMRVEVETNATVLPGPEVARDIDQWNVSPKLASSGNRLRARERASALSWFAREPRAFFKFVIRAPEDVDEATRLCERFEVSRDRVTLMPEGTDVQTIAARSAWLAPACLERGLRLGVRLHVMVWGSERGR